MKIQDLKVGDVLVGKISKLEGVILENHQDKQNIIVNFKGQLFPYKHLSSDDLQGYELKNEYLSFADLVDGEVYYLDGELNDCDNCIFNENKMYNMLTDNLNTQDTYRLFKSYKFKKATPKQVLLFESKQPKKVKGFEVGEYDNLLCWVWDDNMSNSCIRQIKQVDDNEMPFIDSLGDTWENCKPLTSNERKFLEVDSKPINK